MPGVRPVALVLAATALAATLVACGGGGGSYKVTATFEDVGDMQTRGGVQVADVRIGQISGIKLTNDFKAKVTLTMKKGVRIPRDSQALVRTTSLLGEKFIELRPQGDPTRGPFLANHDVVTNTASAPELEFVAESAVNVLGAVSASDVATLTATGAQAFGGRGQDLSALIRDLATISSTLASRTTQITGIIDGLDRATSTLAAGSGDIANLLTNLAQTTTVLADNRQRAIDALLGLARLGRVQNQVLDRYRGDIDRQIKQVDAILGVAAGQTAELGNLVDFLDRFVHVLPQAIPDKFTQVYMWAVPCPQDNRSPQGCP